MLTSKLRQVVALVVMLSPALILVDVNLIFLFAIACASVIPLNAFAFSTVYHKLFAHRSFKPRAWVPYLGTFIASILLLPSPKTFASLHRLHHKYSDTDYDPHTPLHGKLYTFFHNFIRPNEQKKTVPPEIRNAITNDIKRDYPLLYRVDDSFTFGVFVIFNLLLYIISTEVFLVSIFVACVNMNLHGFANTFQHRVNNDGTVTIVDMPLLTQIVSPEFNHATHHARASDYDFSNEEAKDWMAPIIKKYLSR